MELLRNRRFFPIDPNRDTREQLLRVPGLGVKSVNKRLKIRRCQKVRLEDLVALKAGVKRAMPFVVCANHYPGLHVIDSDCLRARFAPAAAAQQSFGF